MKHSGFNIKSSLLSVEENSDLLLSSIPNRSFYISSQLLYNKTGYTNAQQQTGYCIFLAEMMMMIPDHCYINISMVTIKISDVKEMNIKHLLSYKKNNILFAFLRADVNQRRKKYMFIHNSLQRTFY